MDHSLNEAIRLGDLLPHLAHGRAQGPIEHQPQGAVVVVLHDQQDRMEEIGVRQRGGGDEKMTLQRFHDSGQIIPHGHAAVGAEA